MPNDAVVSPGSIPLRETLVRPEAKRKVNGQTFDVLKRSFQYEPITNTLSEIIFCSEILPLQGSCFLIRLARES